MGARRCRDTFQGGIGAKVAGHEAYLNGRCTGHANYGILDAASRL